MTTPDGQVKIYNVDDILGLSPPSKLEPLVSPPNLPSWLTLVGNAYEYSFSSVPQSNLTIQFQYLSRDLGMINEADLSFYYSNDQGSSWERLDTVLDIERNLATAKMPGEGIYALVGTVEMDQFQEGWNNFGYPLRNSMSVPDALASIDDAYTSVYYYDQLNKQWLVFDRTVGDDFKDLVNTLETLEYGRGYWIYVTEVVTPYLGLQNISEQTVSNSFSESNSPPATYFGLISSDTAVLAAGDQIEAFINGNRCGAAQIQALNSGLAYSIQVHVDQIGNCRAAAPIVFRVNGYDVLEISLWNNSQAHLQPLTVTTQRKVFLPVVHR